MIAVKARWHNVSDAKNGIMKIYENIPQFFKSKMKFGNVINVQLASFI